MSRVERKVAFINALADFLAGRAAEKSMALEMSQDETRLRTSPGLFLAREWAALRAASPLRGHQSLEEARDELREFLM